ncbi:MAG: hypothetical protein KUL76_10330 [Kaistella sp.]|nr:hypothetical protein [Kaistella sp.]
MNKRILLIFLLVNFFSVKAQENYKDFKYYYIYEDYVSNKPIEPVVNTEVKTLTSEYIIVGKKVDKETNKKSKNKEGSSWALQYNNDLYFNMVYAQYIYKFDTFSKFDIIGKNYMLIVLNEKTDKKAIGNPTPYGGSIVGSVLNMKPYSSWFDANGDSHKVLLIDRQNPFRVKSSGLKNVLAYLVTSDKVAEIANNNPDVILKLKNKSFKLEDLANLINDLNKE